MAGALTGPDSAFRRGALSSTIRSALAPSRRVRRAVSVAGGLLSVTANGEWGLGPDPRCLADTTLVAAGALATIAGLSALEPGPAFGR